jgi:hypothetical protein
MATLNWRLDVGCIQRLLVALGETFVCQEAAIFKEILNDFAAIFILSNSYSVRHAAGCLAIHNGHHRISSTLLK